MAQRRSRQSEDEWEESDDQEEYTPIVIPPEYRGVMWEKEDIRIYDLWQRMNSGHIVLQPDFQRNYVWDLKKASRYIESLLLGLPTPPVFLAEENDGSLTVIDGHQRLETLFRYMQPLLAGPAAAIGRQHHPYSAASPLALRELEVTPELNGKNVTALTQEARGKLWDTRLSVIRLPRDSHPTMKYSLFARLNQGSMSLNNQELRNCLYRGPYNNLIRQLSEGRGFLRLWGRNAPDKRMRHRELVLRFFALLHRLDRYHPPFHIFLNSEMDEHRDLPAEDAREYQRELEVAMSWVDRVFGTEVFRIFRVGNADNPTGRWVQRRYDLLYEVEMVGFAQFGELLNKLWGSSNSVEQNVIRSSIRHKLVDVMTNKRFIDSINEGTTRQTNVVLRFDLWNQAMNAIVQDGSSAIREGMAIQEQLRRSSVCTVCPNPLTSDDAVWSLSNGGRQLGHRYCQTVQR